MADGFFEGYYPATIVATAWVVAVRGTLGLQVDVDVRNAQGLTHAMSGKIWFTPRTMASPGEHEGGTPKRSPAMRQLNALGYTGTFVGAQGIGTSIDLRGNEIKVQLKEETYNDVTRLRIAWFCDKDRADGPALAKASTDKLASVLGGVGAPAGDEEAEEADDGVPF